MSCSDDYCTCENECDPCFGLTSSNQTIGVEFKPCCCLYDLTEVPQLLTFSTITRELTITRGNTVIIPTGVPLDNPTTLIGSDDSGDIVFDVTDDMGSSIPGFDNAYFATFNFNSITIPLDAPAGYKWVVEIITRSGSAAVAESMEYDVPEVRAVRHKTFVETTADGISTVGSNFSADTQYAPTGMSVSQGANTFSTCIWDNIPQTAASSFIPSVQLWYALKSTDTEVNGVDRQQTLRSIIQWKLYLVAV